MYTRKTYYAERGYYRGDAVYGCVRLYDARVRVWDDHCDGIDQGDAAANWLSAVLEVEGARLVRMKEGARRPCDGRYAPRGSLTAYSDGFPLLLASEASLGALNERIAARGRGKKVPMGTIFERVPCGLTSSRGMYRPR